MKLKITIIVFLLVLTAGAVIYWRTKSNPTISLLAPITKQVAQNLVKAGNLSLLQEVLGFDRPRTYLVLFLNNTELRPSGGFIGAYAVLRVTKGKVEALRVEGTEILDNNAPLDFTVEPPAPLKKYLKINNWKLRDSNWSPDFPTAARQALEFFRREKGVGAEEIEVVIGFTPTVLEEILNIRGPIKVDGKEFSAVDFTEKLEYEVEYGYAQRGLAFEERKQILSSLTKQLLSDWQTEIWQHWPQYLSVVESLKNRKQLMVYSPNADWQSAAVQWQLDGALKSNVGDYLLWVDANLAALKTDAAMERVLSYELAPTGTGRYLATVTMRYANKGKFDWRTTRYRTYARLFVPLGSQLAKAEGAMAADKSDQPGPVERGIELGRQWFGTFISIEPGQSRQFTFQYYLPESVVQQIAAGNYQLLIQKQLGAGNYKLTLGLDFGKKVASVEPAGDENTEDNYGLKTDLSTDRVFDIKLKN